MDFKNIHVLQADIVFKALYYTARKEGVKIPAEITKTYEVLAEQNPKETHVHHTVEVMEYLNDFIISHQDYRDSFSEDEDEDDE